MQFGGLGFINLSEVMQLRILGFRFNFQASDLRLCNLRISLGEGARFGVLNVKVNLWVCYLGIWVKLLDFKWFRHVTWAFLF
jgi:hypothetical protein